MSKIHITSFLRPHGRYKYIEDKQKQQLLELEQQSTTTAAVTATTSADSSQQQQSEVSVNNVELIPTLRFVCQQPIVEPFVAAQSISNSSNNNNDVDEEHDNDSRRTFVIACAAATTSTDNDNSVEEQALNFSLTSTDTSFIDEPTSSISIEMDTFNKTTTSSISQLATATTTTTSAASASATVSSTAEPVETTTNSGNNVMTTTTTQSSSEQSIEEDIEEAIDDISGDLSHHYAGTSDVSALSGVELSEAAGYAHSSTSKATRQRQLFELDESMQSDHEVAKTNRSLEFEIDDDQLSGGKLAQHFVLSDDDDDDDGVDLNISLPMEKNVIHSRHEDTILEDNGPASAEIQKDSLTNQSTTDDVSDFVEELQQEEDFEAAPTSVSLSDSLDLPLPEDLKQKSATSLKETSIKATAADKSNTASDAAAVDLVADLAGGSPEHSEKDHSMEEVIVEANQSIEMLAEKSVEEENIPQSTALTATLQMVPLLATTTDHKTVKVLETLELKPLVVKHDDGDNEIEKTIVICEGNKKSNDNTAELRNTEMESFVATNEKLTLAVDVIENRSVRVVETLQISPIPSKHNVEIQELHPKTEDRSLLTALQPLQQQLQATQRVCNSPEPHEDTIINVDIEDDEDTSMELMKLRIFAMKQQQQQIINDTSNNAELLAAEQSAAAAALVKQMERVPLTDFNKDVLEDITEESERNSLSTADEQQTLSLEKSELAIGQEKSEISSQTMRAGQQKAAADAESSSIVSLNMIEMLEQKVNELQSVLASKDACLASLNLQLETTQRRESSNGGSYEQPVSSGRDLSSLVTNSTEYRTFQEDYGGPTMDFLTELTKRDELIAKLTDSLQQSLNVRENLQTESEKLNNEVQLLRKQLTEAMDSLRRPLWPRDQESNGGQRISEISMDLISESDDDLERQYLTDNEDKISRNSRERQLSLPRQMDDYYQESNDYTQAAFSKQMDQFQKYLTPSEVRLFFMVQKKFDDYLGQELEKCKMKQDQELKNLLEKLESEKQEKNNEINRLLQQRQEKDNVHSKEMEDLRKYFEHKCADLEKQFSDEVFSQKSQHVSADTSSEGSDQENIHEEVVRRSKESSPRKRSRAELLLSPSHRQMTPSSDGLFGEGKDDATNLSTEILEQKAFYQHKIHELQRRYDENHKKLNDKLKYYENRYPEDDFMTTSKISNNGASDTSHQSVTTQVRDPNTSLIIIDQDELNFNNESQVIQKIIEEYEKRLQEQLMLAREDIVHELENQIQTLLSETTTDDHHWPPELILLREKFTAKSQLEIAQLQIKHEDEMSRLKVDYEKQLNRKNKRHSNFDLARDFEQIKAERDSLRELLKTFRHVLIELAKCVVNCEDELNETVCIEIQKLLANRTMEQQSDTLDLNLNLSSSLLNSSYNSILQSKRFVPDVSSLLEIIEDPQLKDFISNKSSIVDGDGSGDHEDFDWKDCMERLRSEAVYLYQLSEEIKHKNKQRHNSESSDCEKNDSCCEAEDGLKISQQHPVQKFMRANSLNEQQLSNNAWQMTKPQQLLNSLPPDLNRLQQQASVDDDTNSTHCNASELNFQLHELRNRLLKSESDRIKLQQKLEHTIRRNAELGDELQTLRDQFTPLDSLNRTDYAEGYGLGLLKSPENLSADRLSASFSQLQERARNLLSTPTQKQQENNNDVTAVLLQMIEDFCREGDKVVECSKKDREDLQKQIDAADKQRKNTQQFLEEQAAEREQERIEFSREIERLQLMLRDKEKERSSYENASKEVEQLESQIRDLNQKLNDSNANRDKFEVELKASIDKIFVLREIIVELEKQVETKALNEHVLEEKIKQLDDFINSQSHSNDMLQHEVQSLKTEISINYQERIRQLEEKLQNVRPSAEQSMVLEQVIEQLHDIENTLDHKTKMLESLHNSISSNSCSLSAATEDVSVDGTKVQILPLTSLPTAATLVTPPQGSPLHPSPRQHSLSMEGVQRIVDKLSKHSRVEEAAIKRIKDLEMQISTMRSSCVELQHERDSLQERMSEQKERISGLQQRLEEQRQRAEELQRAGTSDLNIRIHDLQNELQNFKEMLGSRDKQIANMRQQLDKSKMATDRLEAELTVSHQPDRSIVERLEAELKQRNNELQKLKDKIKFEMINKLALPDLMETMLEDKNEEIDHLKEQLEAKEKELQCALEANGSRNSSGAAGKSDAKEEASTKLSARTLSDILSITEFDEPDVIRRAAVTNLDTPLALPEGAPGANYMQQTMDTSKEAVADLTQKRTDEIAGFINLHPTNTFDNPHYFQDPNMHITGKTGSTITPTLVPRQINFSSFTEDSKIKQSTPTNFSFDMPTQRSRQDSANKGAEEQHAEIEKLQNALKDATEAVKKVEKEKQDAVAGKDLELKSLEENLLSTQQRLGGLQEELMHKQQEIKELQVENLKLKQIQDEVTEKCSEIEELLKQITLLKAESNAKSEALSKHEKNLVNYQQNENNYLQRIEELEAKILALDANSNSELVSLRNDYKTLSDTHEQCKNSLEAHSRCKQQLDALNQEIKAKDERLLMLNTKLSIAEDTTRQFQQQTASMEQEIEKLRSQQQSDSSSKQFSVDEIAQQVEKELNYSAQLDSNILKAIESEEENNLDTKIVQKEQAARAPTVAAVEQQTSTDDENFAGERVLLNQLEALRVQVQVEREHSAEIRQELLQEKLQSQDIQEQDVVIIEAMRKRLETALEQEDELHKQLDQEREKCERLQSQLTVLQRTESRRNSALMKSPTESPRKSPRNSDFESELAERLRSEIKLLTAQNERERERIVDLQRNLERERVRFDTELKDRIEYSDKLNKEMEKVARDKELSEQEVEHLQERLVLQAQEIESLEARIATLQEAETRRVSWRDRQQRESTQNAAEIRELKTKLNTIEAERDSLIQTVTQLRFDIERSASREAKLAEALANANANAAEYEAVSTVPQQFMQKMEQINVLLAENAKENRQMAETVQFLVEERRQLQKKCQELETQLDSNANVSELEERCNHLLGRYLRVESHRKALVYQKRYLKILVQNYQDKEAQALAMYNGNPLQPPRDKKRLFKTVAIAIIAIERMKYIGRHWRTGKRIVSKSVFTITQQKSSQPPRVVWYAAKGATSQTAGDTLMPLQSPALLNDCVKVAAVSTTPNETTLTWAQQLGRQQ